MPKLIERRERDLLRIQALDDQMVNWVVELGCKHAVLNAYQLFSAVSDDTELLRASVGPDTFRDQMARNQVDGARMASRLLAPPY